MLEPEWEAEPDVQTRIRTEFSTTIFSGSAEDWDRYLRLSSSEKFDPEILIRIDKDGGQRTLAFEPLSESSRPLAALLRQGTELLDRELAQRAPVREAVDQLLFGPASPRGAIVLRLSASLPSLGASECGRFGLEATPFRVVIQGGLATRTLAAFEQSRTLSSAQQLGVCWPLLSRVLSALSFPAAPRDRFSTKIDVFARLAFVTLSVLYVRLMGGRLECSPVGAVVEQMVSQATKIPLTELRERHPYYRMLVTIGFALRGRSYDDYAVELRIAAREYLDARYLRLSLAGAMPELAAPMTAMPVVVKGAKLKTPAPKAGRFGIVDQDDLDAWHMVTKRFRDLGYVLVRQLGMGQFGRVYEAVTLDPGGGWKRVAIKVDRIVGKKKRAILEAEMAMEVGRVLAAAPHVVRLYDTGKLPGERFTFHVLQLIDGDTLDTLLGAQGLEHASVPRPELRLESEQQSRQLYFAAVRQRDPDLAQRPSGLPFRYPLSPVMVLDLLSSFLLCVEEVHALGYAINDLKNDNLMLSRRGQVKGIDLDSYSPVYSAVDKYTDFLFLSSSLLFILFNAPAVGGGQTAVWEALAEDSLLLRRELEIVAPFGDVEKASSQRVTRAELVEVLVHLVRRSRSLHYAREPELFSADITRLIALKHRLLVEELIID